MKNMVLNYITLFLNLSTIFSELSHALYQHDAACRVIARLTKEVTAAREALATLKPQAGLTASAASYAQQVCTILLAHLFTIYNIV